MTQGADRFDQKPPQQPERPKPWERDPYRHRGKNTKIRVKKGK